MKVVQIGEHDEQTYTVKVVQEEEVCPTLNCFVIERILFWCIVAVVLFAFLTISWETRTSMHLNNLSLQRSMLRQDHTPHKHSDLPMWMS